MSIKVLLSFFIKKWVNMNFVFSWFIYLKIFALKIKHELIFKSLETMHKNKRIFSFFILLDHH